MGYTDKIFKNDPFGVFDDMKTVKKSVMDCLNCKKSFTNTIQRKLHIKLMECIDFSLKDLRRSKRNKTKNVQYCFKRKYKNPDRPRPPPWNKNLKLSEKKVQISVKGKTALEQQILMMERNESELCPYEVIRLNNMRERQALLQKLNHQENHQKIFPKRK